MKKYIAPILTVSIATIALVFSIYNSTIFTDLFSKRDLGATVTSLVNTMTGSTSMAVLNANFIALNTGKLDNSSYYATTTHAHISSLPALSITKSQVSDFGSYLTAETDPVWLAQKDSYLLTANAFTQAIASTTFQDRADWTTHDNYPAACSAGQYVSAVGDTLTCATPPGTGITSIVSDSPLSGSGTAGSHLVFTNPGYITSSALLPYLANSDYYATTTHKNISSLPALSITKSQVSNLGTLFTQEIASTTFADKNLYVPYTGATTHLNLGNYNASSTQLTTTNSTYLATTGGSVAIGTTSPNSILDIEHNALGVTVSAFDGISLTNWTSAAAGAQQKSPTIHLSGQGWASTPVASQKDDFIIYALPIQGTTNSTASFVIANSINGGAYTSRLTLSSAGALAGVAGVAVGGALTTASTGAFSDTITGSHTATGGTSVPHTGILLAGTTAATGAAPVSKSPSLDFGGLYWDGSVSTTTKFSIENKTNLSFTNATSSALRFSYLDTSTNNYNELMRLDSTGKVGILTSSPNYPLEVQGSASTTQLYLGNNIGTAAGSFLAVNAAGLVIATSTPSGGTSYTTFNTDFDTRLAATTTLNNLTTLNKLSITKSQVSDLGTLFTQAIASTTFVDRAVWTTHDNYPAACSGGNYVTAIGDTLTCSVPAGTTYTANYPITLGGGAFGLAFGTSTSNTWGGVQTLAKASSTQLTVSDKTWLNSLRVGKNTSALVNASTLVQYDDDNGALSDWSFNVASNGYAGINFQSTGGTLASPTASSNSIKSTIVTYAYNSTPAQKAISEIQTYLVSGTAGAESSKIIFRNTKTGTLADRLELTGTALYPSTNDDVALGIKNTNAYSDLYLASGGVIDWNNGNMTLTHSTGLLTLGGGGLTVTAGTLTVGTVAGTIDAGGATSLEIPNGAAVYTNTTGQIAIDTTSGQLRYNSGTATSTLVAYQAPTFTYATSTAWTGTTTIPLGVGWDAETWSAARCFTDAGTLNVDFNDGTNRMGAFNASTTVGTITLGTNNSFTAAEKRYVDVGTPATSPTKISCTIKKTIDAD